MGVWTLGEDGKLRDKSGHIACEHGRERTQCKECGGTGICEHGRKRSQCRACGGASICEHSRERSKCLVCRPTAAVVNYKRGASRRGFSWELSETRAWWLGSQSCTYCGEPIAVGIDRGRNDYGYTVLNSVPCCSGCNYLKGSRFTTREFIDRCAKVAAHNATYEDFKARWIETRTTGPDLEFSSTTREESK